MVGCNDCCTDGCWGFVMTAAMSGLGNGLVAAVVVAVVSGVMVAVHFVVVTKMAVAVGSWLNGLLAVCLFLWWWVQWLLP